MAIKMKLVVANLHPYVKYTSSQSSVACLLVLKFNLIFFKFLTVIPQATLSQTWIFGHNRASYLKFYRKKSK